MSDYRQRISSNSEGVTTMGDFNYTPTRNVKPSIRYETKTGNLSAACLILRAENETRTMSCNILTINDLKEFEKTSGET